MKQRGRNLSEKRHHLKWTVRGSKSVRLDRFMIDSLAWKSRQRLQGLIREGRVTVNGAATKPSRRVRPGDLVELHLSDGAGVPGDYAERRLEILYEDPWLVAIHKPPGMLVHPVGRHVYDTVINYLHYRYHTSGAGGDEVVPRLCHRIDKDTTGVVVVAKDTYVHREVMYQFENRLVAKEYLALVEGRVEEDEATIRLSIGEGRSLESSLEHAVLKASRTRVLVEQRLRGYTVTRCIPHTGRQNQIRIHLAARGHPLAGDLRYGGSPAPGGSPDRYYLHSERLEFYHPRLKQRLEIRAPLPEDFRQLTARLR